MSRYSTTEHHWQPENIIDLEEFFQGIDPMAEDYQPSEEMDGDHESALASAGFGTDEDYGHFEGEDDWLDGSYEHS